MPQSLAGCGTQAQPKSPWACFSPPLSPRAVPMSSGLRLSLRAGAPPPRCPALSWPRSRHCHSILEVITHVILPCSGDVNGSWNGNNISRKSPMVRMTTAPVNFSGLWLSYGVVVLNLLFWMHPALYMKWWISLDFKPPTLYSINKYSFSFSPSSSIFSSIMAEVIAVKALYLLLFISTWFCASLQNYEIIEDWVWTFCLVLFLIITESVFIPRMKPLCYFFSSFSSSTCINHSIGIYCLVKIKMIPKCSRITQGLFNIQYVKAAKTDSQEED